MPIKLPNGLPAQPLLHAEGIAAADDPRSERNTDSVLRIALMNLMPRKTDTEIQIARLLGDTPYRVELSLFLPDDYYPKNTPAEHITAHYHRWSEIRTFAFDGLIVTGAPVETLPFEQVTYWRQLTEVFDWARRHVQRSYYICWAAQAALYHFHDVPKHELDEKRFGIYRHRVVEPTASLLDGFDRHVPVPVSRHTEIRHDDLPEDADISVLAASDEAGLCLLESEADRAVYMFNHLEYEADTLRNEYIRDLAAGKPVPMPKNYFPDDDPTASPVNYWRSHARLLFRNWLADIDQAVTRDRRLVSPHGAAAATRPLPPLSCLSA